MRGAYYKRKDLASIHVNSSVNRYDKDILEIVHVACKLNRLHREALKAIMRDMLTANELRELKAGS